MIFIFLLDFQIFEIYFLVITFSMVLKSKAPDAGLLKFNEKTFSTYSIEVVRKEVLTTEKRGVVFNKQLSNSFKAIW